MGPGQRGRPAAPPGCAAIPAPRTWRAARLLDAAERPFLLLGGNGWHQAAIDQIAGFAERFELPVGTAWRRLEAFDQRHPMPPATSAGP